MYFVEANVVGDMPAFSEVVEAVWGRGIDFDSDGDSGNPNDTTWRELTATLRPKYDQRLEVFPLSEEARDTIRIESTHEQVVSRAADFLVHVGAIRVVKYSFAP